MSLTSKIESLITAGNNTTGQQETDLTSVVQDLVDGYGGGGGTVRNQNKTVTPSESEQSVTADAGYTGLGTVTVEAISNTYVGSGIDRCDSTDLVASGATVTALPGYYQTTSSKSVQSGSVGTPDTTVGSVVNHSVEITPTVTVTEGYVQGETKTGTPATIHAYNLVSGMLEINDNGTTDVTNYASVFVNVSASSSNEVIRTVVINNSAGDVTFDSVLQALEDANYTLTYTDCILKFRAKGANPCSNPPSQYAFNNHTIPVKNGAVWNVTDNRCAYQASSNAPDSFTGIKILETNNALSNSGNIIDSDHKIVNTYASAFQGIGGSGTTVTLYEIPINWNDFFTV